MEKNSDQDPPTLSGRLPSTPIPDLRPVGSRSTEQENRLTEKENRLTTSALPEVRLPVWHTAGKKEDKYPKKYIDRPPSPRGPPASVEEMLGEPQIGPYEVRQPLRHRDPPILSGGLPSEAIPDLRPVGSRSTEQENRLTEKENRSPPSFEDPKPFLDKPPNVEIAIQRLELGGGHKPKPKGKVLSFEQGEKVLRPQPAQEPPPVFTAKNIRFQKYQVRGTLFGATQLSLLVRSLCRKLSALGRFFKNIQICM